MRAMVLEEFGAPLVGRELPDPTAGPGRVLVRVVASGVNPLDTKIREGKAPHARTRLPAVLGLDLAGTVVEADGGLRPGDRVFGLTGGVGDVPGSLAELAAVDARLLVPAPVSIGLREAAALPLAVITAWEGLVDRAGVSAGQKVLVHGGAGGVGHVAVQLARAFGAEVYATASPGKLDVVKELGAIPIDYTTEAVEDYVAAHTAGEGFDIVYDTVGGPALDASFAAARIYTGHVVSALGWGTHSLAPLSFRGATYSGVFTLMPLLTGHGRAHHGEILRRAAELVDAGHLRPRVDARRFGLSEVAEAHRLLSEGNIEGKAVVDVGTGV